MRTTRLRHVLAVVTAAAVLAIDDRGHGGEPRQCGQAQDARARWPQSSAPGRAELIGGTAERDIIVAHGGNDRIYGRGGNDLICAGTGNDLVVGGPGADILWGQLGNDRLHGGPGPDFLAGQVGDDLLNGGISVDKCFQGTGVGPGRRTANCPPPPPPPTLVVAYADANPNHAYDAGDVMIAEIVDSDRSGGVSVTDTINMGQYPTRLDARRRPRRASARRWSLGRSSLTSSPLSTR